MRSHGDRSGSLALVTGATGFVGGHLVRRLVRQGQRVRALVRPGARIDELQALGVEVVPGDVRDAASVWRAVSGASLVYHLARSARSAGSASVPEDTDVEGATNVACAASALRVDRVVFASSTVVYGALRNRSIDEATPAHPHSRFGEAKLRAERVLLTEAASSVVIARLPHVFGRGCQSLTLFDRARRGGLRIYGSGTNHVHPVAVADAVDGLVACGTADVAVGSIYNLAGPAPLTLRELVEAVYECVGGRVPTRVPFAPSFPLARRVDRLARRTTGNGITRLASVEWFWSDRVFDLTRARTDLGFDPTVTAREVIADTAAWSRWRHAPTEDPTPVVS